MCFIVELCSFYEKNVFVKRFSNFQLHFYACSRPDKSENLYKFIEFWRYFNHCCNNNNFYTILYIGFDPGFDLCRIHSARLPGNFPTIFKHYQCRNTTNI